MSVTIENICAQKKSNTPSQQLTSSKSRSVRVFVCALESSCQCLKSEYINAFKRRSNIASKVEAAEEHIQSRVRRPRSHVLK